MRKQLKKKRVYKKVMRYSYRLKQRDAAGRCFPTRSESRPYKGGRHAPNKMRTTSTRSCVSFKVAPARISAKASQHSNTPQSYRSSQGTKMLGLGLKFTAMRRRYQAHLRGAITASQTKSDLLG